MGEKIKIMMVDDEPDLCLIVKMNLEQAGDFMVVTQNDPTKALEMVKQEKPDVVLLDVVMPGMKGSDLAKVLKADPATKTIPIIIVSGKGEMIYNKKKDEFKWQPNNPVIAQTHPDLPAVKGAEALAEAYGVDDYVSKPFTTEVLVEVINDVLQRRRKAQKPKDEDGLGM